MIRILDETERDRLVELIDIQNTATQVDREESAELTTLLDRLFEREPAKPQPEVINGYDIDLLARSLYDARKRIGGPVTDIQWKQHAQRFSLSHRLLIEEARGIAREDDE